MKNSYQLYRELYDYKEQTEQLSQRDETVRSPDKHFVSAVCFGYGTFTLYLSMIPQKVTNWYKTEHSEIGYHPFYF